MLRDIDHFIGGASYASDGREGDVFDPNKGAVQARVRSAPPPTSSAQWPPRAPPSRPGPRPTRSAAPG